VSVSVIWVPYGCYYDKFIHLSVQLGAGYGEGGNFFFSAAGNRVPVRILAVLFYVSVRVKL
jgi:hypothetical protein